MMAAAARVSGLAERVTRLGVRVEIITPDQLDGGIVLLDIEAAIPDGAGGLVRVRPNRVQDQSDLAKLLEDGWTVPSRPETSTLPS